MNNKELQFGQLLRAIRAERGWSQQELAQLLKCSMSMIVKYETNKTRDPGISVVNKVKLLIKEKNININPADYGVM